MIRYHLRFRRDVPCSRQASIPLEQFPLMARNIMRRTYKTMRRDGVPVGSARFYINQIFMATDWPEGCDHHHHQR